MVKRHVLDLVRFKIKQISQETGVPPRAREAFSPDGAMSRASRAAAFAYFDHQCFDRGRARWRRAM